MFEEVCIIKDEIHRRFDVCAVDTYRVGSQEGVNNVFERLAEVILNLICENRLFDLDGGDDLFFRKVRNLLISVSVCVFNDWNLGVETACLVIWNWKSILAERGMKSSFVSILIIWTSF